MKPQEAAKIAFGKGKKRTCKEKKTKAKSSKGKRKGQKHWKVRCPICYNNMNDLAVSSTRCGHVFCTNCLQQALRVNPVCPTCRRPLRGAQAYHALFLNDNIIQEMELESEFSNLIGT